MSERHIDNFDDRLSKQILSQIGNSDRSASIEQDEADYGTKIGSHVITKLQGHLERQPSSIKYEDGKEDLFDIHVSFDSSNDNADLSVPRKSSQSKSRNKVQIVYDNTSSVIAKSQQMVREPSRKRRAERNKSNASRKSTLNINTIASLSNQGGLPPSAPVKKTSELSEEQVDSMAAGEIRNVLKEMIKNFKSLEQENQRLKKMLTIHPSLPIQCNNLSCLKRLSEKETEIIKLGKMKQKMQQMLNENHKKMEEPSECQSPQIRRALLEEKYTGSRGSSYHQPSPTPTKKYIDFRNLVTGSAAVGRFTEPQKAKKITIHKMANVTQTKPKKYVLFDPKKTQQVGKSSPYFDVSRQDSLEQESLRKSLTKPPSTKPTKMIYGKMLISKLANSSSTAGKGPSDMIQASAKRVRVSREQRSLSREASQEIDRLQDADFKPRSRMASFDHRREAGSMARSGSRVSFQQQRLSMSKKSEKR